MGSSFTFLIQFTGSHSLQTRFATRSTRTCIPESDAVVEPFERLQTLPCMVENNSSIPNTPCESEVDVVSDIAGSVRTGCIPSDSTQIPLLQSKTQNMSQRFYELKLALISVLPDWTTSHEIRYCEFFSDPQLSNYLDLYWSMWHPNWPVLHRPTFDAETVPPSLVAAMVLVGACYSSDRQVRSNAYSWFDAVEILAFRDLQLNTIDNASHGRIQSIQAAFLVCVYQSWNGQAAAGPRMRCQRFGSIVSTVRCLDIDSADQMISPSFETFNWKVFIRREEKIRTLLWVFLLDAAYVIFNNTPPRLVCRELRMGVASCEASYQATTGQECFDCLQAWHSHNPRPNISLYSLIKLFFTRELPAKVLENLAYENFINLWCVNAAFHVAIFNIDLDMGAESQLYSVQIALDNWASVWMRRRRNNNEKFFDFIVVTDDDYREKNNSDWRKPGFWKHALEYWNLAHVVLKHMVAARESVQAADSLCGLYAFHREVSCHVGDVVDDTSMDNLHRFLLTSELQS